MSSLLTEDQDKQDLLSVSHKFKCNQMVRCQFGPYETRLFYYCLAFIDDVVSSLNSFNSHYSFNN